MEEKSIPGGVVENVNVVIHYSGNIFLKFYPQSKDCLRRLTMVVSMKKPKAITSGLAFSVGEEPVEAPTIPMRRVSPE